jgi:hypothetical protein
MSEQSQQRRAAVQHLLDRIVCDPAYRQELLDNPSRALQALGIEEQGEEPEVTGYLMCRETCGTVKGYTCTKTCTTCTQSY